MHVSKQKEKAGPLLNGVGQLVTDARGEHEDFPSCLLCLIFISKVSLPSFYRSSNKANNELLTVGQD